MENNFQYWHSEKWIIAVFSMTIFAILVTIGIHAYTKFSAPPVQQISVSVSPSTTDSSYNFPLYQIDSLIQCVADYDKMLQEKYQAVVGQYERERERQSFFAFIIEMLACLLGFLGIRTFADIRAKAKDIAKEQSKNTAERIASSIAKDTTTKTIEGITQSLVNKKVQECFEDKKITQTLINDISISINPRFTRLEDRILTLEKSSPNGESEPIDEPVFPTTQNSFPDFSGIDEARKVSKQ